PAPAPVRPPIHQLGLTLARPAPPPAGRPLPLGPPGRRTLRPHTHPGPRPEALRSGEGTGPPRQTPPGPLPGEHTPGDAAAASGPAVRLLRRGRRQRAAGPRSGACPR